MADAVVAAWNLPQFKRPWWWRACVTRGVVGGQQVVVLKPQTYMNRSGLALGRLLKDRAFDPTLHLLVLVDDVALPLGAFRLRARGSAGGHNGLKSIAGRLRSEHYARLRIGVGPRPDEEDPVDHLLSEFAEQERTILDQLLPQMTEAVQCWVQDGIESAMNRFNRRGSQRE